MRLKRRPKYVGSVVLGLNDALVELTGALAGFTLALQNARLIAVVGLITGVAAALSMGASEYLSIRTDGSGGQHPIRASLYTGTTYIITVLFLVLPFFIFTSHYTAMLVTLIIGIIIIAGFTYYIAKINKVSFLSRFLEMAGISLGITLVSFAIGYLIRTYLGIDL
jgi:vacuolar iron transporter family protein